MCESYLTTYYLPHYIYFAEQFFKGLFYYYYKLFSKNHPRALSTGSLVHSDVLAHFCLLAPPAHLHREFVLTYIRLWKPAPIINITASAGLLQVPFKDLSTHHQSRLYTSIMSTRGGSRKGNFMEKPEAGWTHNSAALSVGQGVYYSFPVRVSICYVFLRADPAACLPQQSIQRY